ncbi:MAG: FAD/NAD(P)-binding oxidoreductase [Firmicutes bacterium]|nr:FAD/NAD(P)-binding oxidoreductase [Bacillota bacterium]
MKKTRKTDIVIVGGGIVGTAIARELAKYELDIILVEQQPDLAMGTTKANSAIMHAGYDAPEGSLKAKLNVRGNELYRQLKDELDLELAVTGSLVVAVNQAEMDTLVELKRRGKNNGVPGLEILSREEVLVREPSLSPDILGALYAPTGGMLWPFTAAFAFAENAVRNGVKVITECAVTGIEVVGGKTVGVHTSRGFIEADYVINAAGVHSDEVSRMAGDESFTIKPRKGEYILFDKSVKDLVKTIIFPTPSKISKGILLSQTVHGNVFIGPNAIDTNEKDDVSTTSMGMEEIIVGAKRLVPSLPLSAAITQFTGVRAVADSGDFIIRASSGSKGLIQAAGIQSPGLTAAPAIAEMIAVILKEEGLTLKPKIDFKPANPRRVVFSHMDHEARQALIAKNPLHGRIICRCETVTEGEIVDAIHRPCGARSVDGIKRRLRPGAGRCQGGFCGPRVTAILARELNIPVTAVRKDTADSYMFYDKIPGSSEVKTDA